MNDVTLRIRVDREAVSITTLDELGARYAPTACDVAYLELAVRRRLPLVTRDAAWSAAIPKAGIAPA